MKIAIVIVNYRTPELVAECLESLKSEFGQEAEIRAFVGDSCSGDHSEQYLSDFIAEHCSSWCRFIPIGKNGGFAYGNNYLVRHGVLEEGGFDYVHFLNPDAYIHAGGVMELARFLEQNPGAGVAGSRLENPDGTPRAFAFRFPSPWRQFHAGARLGLIVRLFPSAPIVVDDLSQPAAVDWVSGASFMVPMGVMQQVGLMDERYFLYFEETDYMFRIKKAGNGIWHVPASRVVHLAGQSTGVKHTRSSLKRLPAYWFQSRYKFLADNYGRLSACTGIVLFILGDLLYRLKCCIKRQAIEDPPQLLTDLIRHGFSMPPARD